MTQAAIRRLWMASIAALAALISVTSLLPPPMLPTNPGPDKLQHFAAYFLLALMASGIVPPDRLARAMLRCFVFGLVLEGVQGLVTEHRVAEWTDIAANGAGVAAAWLIASGGRAGWGLRIAQKLGGNRSP